MLILLFVLLIGFSILFIKYKQVFYRIIKELTFAVLLSMLFIGLFAYQRDLFDFSNRARQTFVETEAFQFSNIIDDRLSENKLLNQIDRYAVTMDHLLCGYRGSEQV